MARHFSNSSVMPCFRDLRLFPVLTWIGRLLLITVISQGIIAQATIVPYISDPNPLFLFHFDEAAGGSVATNVGSIGGQAYSVNLSSDSATPPLVTTVIGASSGYPNFGNCANLYPASMPGYLIGFDANGSGAFQADTGSSSPSLDAIPMSELNMGNGGPTPWTLEAMICPSVTNQQQEIICTDNSGSNPPAVVRGFQFRLSSAGTLQFDAVGLSTTPQIQAAIPSTGTNAFVANTWYHVAVTYDGANLRLYWTKVDPSITTANLIAGPVASDIGASFGAVAGPLCIGGENRSANQEYFRGLIDEVRISNVARAPNDMLFNGGVAINGPFISPPDSPIYAGTMVTLSATARADAPLSYFWQTDGGSGGSLTNIPGANTNTYTLDTAGMNPGVYRFDLVVTNDTVSATSSVVTLNLTNASGPVLVTDTRINPSPVLTGNSATMSASFAGTEPIAYQWFFTPNGGGTRLIPAATNATYTIPSTQTNDAGSYFLTASNSPPGLGSQFMSSTPATLTVLETPVATGMFCDLLEHPEETVISDLNPKFGWVYTPSFRNDSQSGYQIIVASSLALAASDTGDMWDSGIVSNSSSINVPYAGAPLLPNTSYFWRVRTVNSAGRLGNFSAIQQINTASQVSDPLTTSGVVYQPPQNGSANCYPLRYQAFAPVLVTNTAPGVWFIDFGQDAFGYATVHLNGDFSGMNAFAALGEMANGNTVVPGPSGSTVRYRTTSLPLQNGDITYTVRSTNSVGGISPPASYGIVSPFRYLELSNFPGTLTAAAVTQYRLATEFDPDAASFDSSSPALNQVWNLCHNSMRWLNFDGIYADGDRERKPYEADTYIHQLSSYAVDNDFVAPRCTFEYLTSHPTWPTEWKFHMILVAWADYLQTGDPYLITKYYSTLQQDSFTWAATGNGLMKGFPNYPQTTDSDIVDWPAADRDGFVISSGGYLNWTNAVNNAFYYHCLRIMACIAEITGHTNDASTYSADADQVYNVYNSTFWDTNSQSYVDGVGTTHSSAHANFFPLAFGLVPPSNQVAVVNYLHSRIAANDGMPCSVYGAQYLLDALFRSGDADTALDLMTTNGPRGWMNMINMGSTLTIEAWNFQDKPNMDWNHPWGAAAGNLIARYVLGLRPLAAGFGRILIQPQLGTLSFVQGTVPTIRGPVSLYATNAPGQFQLLVNIPGNVTATVMLPTEGATAPAALVDGNVTSGTVSNNWLIITNIGSGRHAIWLNTNSAPSTATLYNNWTTGWFGTNANNAAIAGPTADPDGDGVNNYDEFIAGTDPLDPTDRFHILNVDYSNPGPVATVTIVGKSGRHYTLQHTLALDPAVWSDADTKTATANNQVIQLNDSLPNGSSQAFLRVAVNYP